MTAFVPMIKSVQKRDRCDSLQHSQTISRMVTR